MIKTLLLFLSLLFSQTSDWGVITKNISTEGEIIWSDGITSLVKEDEENYIIIHQNGWQYFLNDVDNPKVLSQTDTIAVIYWKQKEFYFLRIDKQGNVVDHILVMRDATIKINDFLVCEENVFLVGSIIDYDQTVITSQKEKALKDILILKITSSNQIIAHVLGGLKEEEGLGLIIDGKRSFLFFRKDSLTGGDFEYSGVGNQILAIAILNEQMQPVHEIAINDINHLQSYCLYDNMLCFVIDDQLCYFNEQLESIHKINLNGPFNYTQMGNNGSLLLVNPEKICLFDLAKNYLVGEIPNEEFKEGRYFFTNKGIFYQDFQKTCLLDFYWNEDQLTTLYGIAEVKEETYNPSYDPQIYGTYQKMTKCLSKGELEFSLLEDIEVPLEVNIVNGGIYPLNYQLLFTGKAYINGNEILNNYTLSEEKKVILDLVGANGQITSFQFYISRKQVTFTEDKHNTADFEVTAGEKYQLIYEIEGIEEVEKVVVNGKEIEDFVYHSTTHKLVINLIAPVIYGNHLIEINQVIYRNQNQTAICNLGYDYVVKVIKKAPLLELTNLETSISVNCLDNDKTIRYFEIVLLSNNKEETISYPLSDDELIFSQLVQGQKYQATIHLIYDIGSLHYQRHKILDFEFIAQEQNIPIGNIIITRYSDSLEQFLIAFTDRFSKTSLLSAQMGDKKIIQKTENTDNRFLFWSIGVIVISVGLGYGIRKWRRLKNNLVMEKNR